MDKVKELRDDFDKRARFAQIKRDGTRLRITKDAVGKVRAWTRKPKEWTHLVKELPRCQTLWTKMQNNIILHGELWVPNTPATSVITMVKSKSPEVLFSVFGIESPPSEANRGIDFASWGLDKVFLWCKQNGLDFVEFYNRGIRCAGSIGSFSSLQDLPKPHGDIEGYVFKDYNGQHRGDGWQKWTKTNTICLQVTGTNPARKGTKYDGQVGSLICSDRNGKEVCSVSSGLNDRTRYEITQNPDHFIGRIAELEYKNIAALGGLRMPRFIGFRDDIGIDQCDTLDTVRG